MSFVGPLEEDLTYEQTTHAMTMNEASVLCSDQCEDSRTGDDGFLRHQEQCDRGPVNEVAEDMITHTAKNRSALRTLALPPIKHRFNLQQPQPSMENILLASLNMDKHNESDNDICISSQPQDVSSSQSIQELLYPVTPLPHATHAVNHDGNDDIEVIPHTTILTDVPSSDLPSIMTRVRKFRRRFHKRQLERHSTTTPPAADNNGVELLSRSEDVPLFVTPSAIARLKSLGPYRLPPLPLAPSEQITPAE